MLELLCHYSTMFYERKRVTMSAEFVGYVVLCSNCGKFMGNVDSNELEYVNEDKDSNLCFDCSPDADSVHECLSGIGLGSRLFLSGYETITMRFSRPASHAHAHERTHAHARARGLSSSTYLNRIYKNRVLFTDMREGYPCRVCEGEGEITTGRITVPCSFCDGEGKVTTAIFLPLWLVNGVRENA